MGKVVVAKNDDIVGALMTELHDIIDAIHITVEAGARMAATTALAGGRGARSRIDPLDAVDLGIAAGIHAGIIIVGVAAKSIEAKLGNGGIVALRDGEGFIVRAGKEGITGNGAKATRPFRGLAVGAGTATFLAEDRVVLDELAAGRDVVEVVEGIAVPGIGEPDEGVTNGASIVDGDGVCVGEGEEGEEGGEEEEEEVHDAESTRKKRM